MIRALVSLMVMICLAQCTSRGGLFCEASGHTKGTVAFKQCEMRYRANETYINHCRHSGLVVEGPQLTTCIDEARKKHQLYNKNNQFCRSEAQRVHAPLYSRVKKEQQATLHPDGQISVGVISLKQTFGEGEIGPLKNNYVNACMNIHGWPNAGSWGSKNNVSFSHITNGLSQLNKKNISFDTPSHQSVAIFRAIADNNPYLVKDIIAKGANVNAPNYQGYTALHVASRLGNFQVAQVLLEQLNADTNPVSFKGESAISLASAGGHHSLAHYITQVISQRQYERARAEEKKKYEELLKAQQEVAPTDTSAAITDNAVETEKEKSSMERRLEHLIEKWK